MPGSNGKGPLTRINDRIKRLAALCTEMNEDIGGAYEEIEELRVATAARFTVIDKKIDLIDSHETRIRWLETKVEKRGRPAK